MPTHFLALPALLSLSPLSIPRDSLPFLKACVVLDPSQERFRSVRLESARYDTLDPMYQIPQSFGDSCRIVGWRRSTGPSQFMAVDRKTGTALILLRDLVGFENQRNVVTFWKVKGSVFEFRRLDPLPQKSAIGRVTIEHFYTDPKGRRFVIFKSKGGDGGDWWGEHRVYRWTRADTLEPVYSEEFAKVDGRGLAKLSGLRMASERGMLFALAQDTFYRAGIDGGGMDHTAIRRIDLDSLRASRLVPGK